MKRLTESELAERWDVSTRSLQLWRKAKRGPAFVRLGERSVFYRESDIEDYERTHTEGTDIRSTIKRAASALDLLSKKAATPKARETLTTLRDELRALLN